MVHRFIPMIPYLNFSKKSGVRAYGFVNLTTKDAVMIVEFKDQSIYAFMEQLTGEENFAKLKELAEKGEGLATFISQNRAAVHGLRLKVDGSIYAKLPDSSKSPREGDKSPGKT